MTAKRLILIRHAHRDVTDRHLDNGLSEKGWEQARALVDFGKKELKRVSAPHLQFWTSAKLRCQETLEPLSEHFQIPLQIDNDLFEQRDSESDHEFLKRLAAFLPRIAHHGPQVLVACSHGDVIPILIEKAVGLTASVKKGSWTELEWTGEKWKFVAIHQTPGRD